jgi:hypothetical protein
VCVPERDLGRSLARDRAMSCVKSRPGSRDISLGGCAGTSRGIPQRENREVSDVWGVDMEKKPKSSSRNPLPKSCSGFSV